MTISQTSLAQAEKLIPKGTPNRKGVVKKVAEALEKRWLEGIDRGQDFEKTLARINRVIRHSDAVMEQ